MRYEDASGAFQASGPVANDDADTLAAGSRGPATGNLITGEGTQYGAAGADSAAGAQVAAIAGQGGEDSSFSAGKLSVAGAFGQLTVDAEGNYSYLANDGAPENVRDRFTYTLADSEGNTDTAALIVEIGKTPAVIRADAQQIVPGPDGVITLPPGVELSDIMVVGRNLVVNMPDGTQLIIVDGAVFVPQLVLGGVEVPATNVATLLIGQEPQPAAGETPPSSGGNFALPPPPLDPGVPLGDLLPPTEYDYTPPEPQETFVPVDNEPEIFVQPDGQPATIAAVDEVDEAGLPTRNGEPEGSGEGADGNPSNDSDPSEATGGVIVYNSPDGVDSITINGVVVTTVGQVIAGEFGTLTITSIAEGQIGYTYTLLDNTSGDATHDDFLVVLTDSDGDQASATLTVNIIDDTPTAVNDTDSIAAGEFGPATGNVLTDADPGDVGDSDNGADTVGADDAELTNVTGFGTTTPGEGGWVVQGEYGVLTINADGSYSYVRDPGAPGGVTDIFNYTLTDGDGDTSTATLTIDIGDAVPETGENPAVLLDDDALANGNAGGVGDDADAVNVNGTLAGSGGDGSLTFDLLLTGAPAGFTYVDGPNGSVLVQQGGVTVLTITIDAATGEYSVTQNAPIDHPAGSDENNVSFTINYRVSDADGDTADGTLSINVDDDTPVVEAVLDSEGAVTVDESGPTAASTITIGEGIAKGDDENVAGSGPIGRAVGSTAVVDATALFGADGPSGSGLTYSLQLGSSDTPLTLTDGSAIELHLIGGVVVGVVTEGAHAGEAAFAIAINPATGVATVELYLSVDHPMNPDPNDALPLGPDTVSVVVTATDGDGDTAGSDPVDISGLFEFRDDGPSVDPELDANATVTVDESLPSDTPGIDTGGIAKGNDPDLDGGVAIGQANSGVAIVDANALFGADGPAAADSIVYALSITNSDAGVTLTDGTPIVLTMEGGVIVGVVDGGSFDGQAAFAIAIDPDTGVVTVEQYLSLDHPVNPDPNDPLGLGDNSVAVTVTATDGDGDPVTSDAIDISGQITFLDDGPSVDPELNANATVTVDESLPSDDPGIDTGGIVKGNDPDLDGGVALGQANSGVAIVDANALFGADGPAAGGGIGYALSITDVNSGVTLTDGTPINLVMVGGVIVGVVDGGTFDGQAAFAIAIDPDTGVVTVEQYLSLDHPVNPDPNDPLGLGDNSVAVTVTATDGDGDPVTSDAIDISNQITFLDDGPSADPVLEQDATVTVDESLPSAADSIDTPGIVKGDDPDLAGGLAIGSGNSGVAVIDVNAFFGADGAAAGGGVGYELSILNASSGLTLTDGSAIELQLLANGVVVGVVDGGTFDGQAAFAIAIDPSTGVVTVEQYLSLDHPVNPDPNDPLGLGENTLGVTATITDGDGDSITTDAIDISDQITFLDDGPMAEVDEQAELDTLVLDETTPPGTETDGDSDPAGLVTTTANFADNFSAIINYGADGPGSVSYSFVLDGEDVASGLYAVDPSDMADGTDGDGYGQGSEILLNASPDGLTITGSVGTDDYFTISIDPVTGVVTFTQLDNIWHANTGSDDDTSALMAAIGSLLVRQTVVDGDGDSATADIDISQGVFQIEDDGPVATDDVDEIVAGGETAEGNVLTGEGTNAGLANADDVGADQPGRISQVSGFGGTDAVFEGGFLEIAGQYGTLKIDADGNYTYTRSDGGAGDVQDIFTYTLIDADGDTDTGTLTINIGDAAPNLPDPATVLLDDDALANGNPGGVGDNVDQAGLPGQLAGTGGDGDLDYNFTSLDNLPLGFTANHVDGSTVQILQGATIVLTITLDNETGAFNVVQNNPIDHLAGDNENNYQFSIGVEVEDADGDKEPAAITINVDDDTPVLQNVTAGGSVDVDETDAGSPGDFPISDTSTDPVIDADMLFGADGQAAVNSIVYGLTIVGGSPEPSGLSTAIGDHPITLVQIDADTIEGQYEDGGTQLAFTIQINPDGTVTLTQEVPLEHLQDGGVALHNDSLDLDGLINATVTITDGDGDSASASAPIGGNLVFFDDGPDAQVNGEAPLDVITLDETRPEGTDTAGGSAPTGDASATANFADNFAGPADHGGDGPGTVSYALQLSAEDIGSGLFALDSSDSTTGDGDGYGQGDEITLSQTGNTITGSANGTDYFTISIDPVTGVVTFTQINPIWHPTAPSNFDEAATLTTATAAGIQVVQTVTDSDGDTDSASINVGAGVFVIQDDGPQAIQPDAAVLENEAGASITADLDDDGEVITDFGEDGEGLVQFANVSDGDDSGLTSDGDPITYWVSDDGQTLEARANSTDGIDGDLIFTVQINQASGDYTVTMTGTVDNGAGVSFNNLTSTAAGNVEYRGVGANDPLTTVDLLLSASKNDDADPAYEDATINTDSDSIGSANQSMDAEEAVRIDFVSNLQSPAGTPSGFSYDGHVETNSLLQTIPQVQGSQAQTVDFTVYALHTSATDADELDRDPSDGISDSTVVEITEVTVIGYVVSANPALDEQTPVTLDISGLADGATVNVAYGISVTKNADGTVTFHGVQEGDQYGISTGSNDFNAVLVDAHDSFDLGVFSIGQVDTGEPINLSFDLQIVDADGDTVSMPGAIDITLEPAVDGFAATSFSSQEEQLQKTAANSNTLTMAAAVAAAGLAETAAAAPTDTESLETFDASATSYSSQVVEKLVVEGDESGAISDPASSELSGAEAGPGNSSGHASGTDMSGEHQLDASSSHPAAGEVPASQSAEDQGPAANADVQVASAPTVAMVSAEALQAAGLDGLSSETGSVEQVLADALGHGAAPTIDDLLAGLPGGIGGLPELAQLASHDSGFVPGWDMASHAVVGGGFDMMFKVDVATHHQDAIQPAVNG